MTKWLIGILTFTSLSALANPCKQADYSCPKKGLLTEAQSLGRVCQALEKGKIGSYRFALALKNSLNECTKQDKNGNVAAYIDMPMTEETFSRCHSVSDASGMVLIEQRQVYY